MRFTVLSVRGKVLASTVLVVALVATLTALYYPTRYARTARTALETRTRHTAEMVALGVGIGLRLNRLGTVSAAVDWAKQDPSLEYVLVADPAGQVFADFDPRDRAAGIDVSDTPLDRVIERAGLMEVAVPIAFQGEDLGTLQLGMSLAAMHAEVALFRWLALAISLLGLGLGTVAALFFANRITRPLRELERTAQRVADGDYSVSPDVRSGDEVAALSQSFATMVERVRASHAQLASQAEELAYARDEALAAAQAKADFLAAMSHEIRTPMNGVIGMLELLGVTQLTDRQKDYIRTATGSGKALLTIIDDILDFSKIEAGKLNLEHAAFDLRETVDDVTHLLMERAVARGIDLSCVVDRDLPEFIMGDAVRLRQVLFNLGGNAVKFTNKGSVRIRLRRARPGEAGARLRFDVTDTGIGIPEDVQPLLFRPFSQADGSTTRRFGGTGLGLSISRRLVELMGGEIGFSSTAGKGSNFWFILPLAPAEARGLERRRGLAGRRALFVRNGDSTPDPLVEYLAAWGMAVETVDTARHAAGAIAEAKRVGRIPDLLVLADDEGRTDAAEPWMQELPLDPALNGLRTVLLTRAATDRNGGAGPSGFDAVLNRRLRYDTLYTELLRVLGQPAEDRPPALSASGAAGGAIPRAASVRILLVEDNEVNQTVIASMLEHLGSTPTVAADGAEAIDRFMGGSFDLILMDCHMPVLDGYEATRRIRALEAESGRERMPIVALTASALQGEEERCLEAGMDGYLTKPITLEALAAELDRRVCASAAPAAPGTNGTNEPASGLGDLVDAPVLDDSILSGIRALRPAGGPDPLDTVVEQFVRTTQHYLEQLRAAGRDGDVDALRRISHTLKSSTAMVGARRLSVLCREAENAARGGALHMAAALVEPIADEYERVRNAFRALERGGSHAA